MKKKCCSIDGCNGRFHARGFCRRHYQCFRLYGDASYVKRPQLVFKGKSGSIAEWAAKLGMDPASLSWRLNHGWSIEKALTTPRGRHGPPPKHVRLGWDKGDNGAELHQARDQ